MMARSPLLYRTYARLDSERRGAHCSSSEAFMKLLGVMSYSVSLNTFNSQDSDSSRAHLSLGHSLILLSAFSEPELLLLETDRDFLLRPAPDLR